MMGVRGLATHALLAAAVLALPLTAFAACTNPVGAAGDIMYSTPNSTMYYCNNTGWIVMGSNVPTGLGSLSTGAFCTAASGSQINCTTGSIGLASQVTGTLPLANGGTGATSLTQGSVAFGGSGGVYSQDNSNFFWDATNHRLGIGTATPSSPLHIYSTGTNALLVQSTSANSAGIQLKNSAAGGHDWTIFSSGSGPAAAGDFGFYDNTGGGARLVIDTSGNVGIGTTVANYQLDVQGSKSIGVGTYGSTDARIEVGEAATGSHYAFLDLTGDTTYTDYGLRVLRGNSGANTNSEIDHRGTGPLNIVTIDAGPIVFNTTSAERMRILPGGNVAIGTTNTAGTLTVSGGTDRMLNVRGDPTAFSLPAGLLGPILQGVNSAQSATEPITLFSSGTYLMGGNVAIGTTTTAVSAVLTIKTATTGAGWPQIALVGNAQTWRIINDGGSFVIDNGTSTGSFGAGVYVGNGGSSWNALSDRRLKTDIVPIGGALDKVSQITGVTYKWIDPHKSQERQIGVIAQDVEKVFPELVTELNGNKGVNYSGLTAPLIQAVKELKSLFDSDHAALAKLKADNDNLRAVVETQGRELEVMRAAGTASTAR